MHLICIIKSRRDSHRKYGKKPGVVGRVEGVGEAEAAVIGTSVQLYASAACADMAKETDDST